MRPLQHDRCRTREVQIHMSKGCFYPQGGDGAHASAEDTCLRHSTKCQLIRSLVIARAKGFQKPDLGAASAALFRASNIHCKAVASLSSEGYPHAGFRVLKHDIPKNTPNTTQNFQPNPRKPHFRDEIKSFGDMRLCPSLCLGFRMA